MQNPEERANQLHDLLPNERTKRHTTTAVGITTENISIIGTSENYLRLELKEAFKENEISAKCKQGNHAEKNILEEAEDKQLTITDIGASRPICLDCEIKIKEKGIKSWTIFSGKKSRKRKD